MKEIINKTMKKLVLDLNSFHDNGRRKAVRVSPKSSVVIEDSEARSRQVVRAEAKGAIELVDAKKSSKKEDKVEDKKEDISEDSMKDDKDDIEDKKTKKSNKKEKTSNKEDK